jgi:endoglycosylceramidase
MLHALTRVYPRIIAGTPLAFRYKPVERTFYLEYSTQLPGPGTGANVTRIVVPPSLYPSGYTVAVTHGTVVSQAPPFLDIAADPWQPSSPLTVTVDIRPNGIAR